MCYISLNVSTPARQRRGAWQRGWLAMRRFVNNFITKISHHKTYRKCCILPFHTQGGHSGGHLCPFRLSITCKLCCHVTAWLSSSLVVLCVLVLSNCSCLLFSSSFSFPGHNNSCQTMRTVHCDVLRNLLPTFMGARHANSPKVGELEWLLHLLASLL